MPGEAARAEPTLRARTGGSKSVQSKLETVPSFSKPKSLTQRLTFIDRFDDQDYNFAVSIAVLLTGVCAVAEQTASTAYGRFGNSVEVGLDPRIGWWLMELPCSCVFVYQFFVVGGPQSKELVPRLMAAVFCCHYLYRGWIFPSMINVHKGSRYFSIVPAFFSWIVTSLHAYLNAKWFSTHGKHLTKAWLRSPMFVAGVIFYYSGLYQTVQHDTIIRNLRPCPSGERYCIPLDGFFSEVICAQYFAELWAWFGFTLLSCGPNGLFILLVSTVNLLPRSVATHTWYAAKFGEDFTKLGLKYLLPGVW